jgi:hypothetical protein
MKKNIVIFIFIYIFFLYSCAIFNSYEKQINNYSYPNNLSPDKTLQMDNGYFEKSLMQGFDAKIQASVVDFKEGELNNDDTDDAISIVAVSTSGNEVYYYLYAFTGKNGDLKYVNHILIGDRIKIKLLKIMNKKIYLAFLTKDQNDSQDNPTQLKKVVLILKDNKLIQTK